MNTELKKLILDICRAYPVADLGVALTITSNRFRITLDISHPQLDVMVLTKYVYRAKFKVNGDTALDRDITDIYNAMREKLRIQERQQMANDSHSLQAIKELRMALQYDVLSGKGL